MTVMGGWDETEEEEEEEEEESGCEGQGEVKGMR